MKKIIIIFSLLISSTIGFAQSPNIGLQYIDHETQTTQNYITSNINSDFGLRCCDNCSLWHRGIDINREGELDYGDRILSPTTGIIQQIRAFNTYIVLVIEGPNDQNYGYGHIFSDYSNSNLPQVSGNFVLKKMDEPYENTLAIIDITNNRAFSTVPNGTVTYGDYPRFTTTRTVQQIGWPVAPVGNSFAANGTHLHLYLSKNPLLDPRNINNAKNPLQSISHQITNFDISIEAVNKITEYEQTSFYSGDIKASVKVKISMVGAGNTSIYDNQIMDIDSVLLLLKKFGEDDNKYSLIKGDNYFSKLVLGGRLDHKRYPSPNWPPSNASFDIAIQYGSNSITGIEPHAYSNGPYDRWLFSDFYTRIHKDDNFTGPLKLAASNSEARYPDGVYFIKPKAYRIDNSEAVNIANPNNNEPKKIIIDNFRPYISNVRIKEYGATNYKYNRGWQWVNNSLLFEPLQNPELKFDRNKDVVIEVTTSEPMQWVNITVGSCFRILTCGSDLNKTKWEFTIPKSDLINGRNQIILDGRDLADNPIQSNPAFIPIRQSDINWTPLPCPGTDNYHSFISGNTSVDFSAIQLGSPVNTVRFTDESVISGSYFWHFGWTTNATSTDKDVDFQYPNPGVYNVSHSVDNTSVSKLVSVNVLSLPKGHFVYSPDFTGYKGNSSTVEVDFFSTSEGTISSYLWDFGNGITSTEQNPEDIVFELNSNPLSNPLVKLTVTNYTGSDTYSEELYLDPSTYPFASIFDWELNYFLHDLEIATSNFNLNHPLKFEINFGDGTSQTVENIYNSYFTFTHQYFTIGRFLVVVKVTGVDNNGSSMQVANAKEISVYPNEIDVQIVHQSENEPPYPMQQVDFSALIDPPGDFWGNWSIYRQGDPLFFFSQNFSSSNPLLSYSFPEAGIYRITINVNTNGGPSHGYSEIEIEVVNAPKFLDVDLYGLTTLCQNSSFTYTARLWPVGEPGVPDNEWYASDLRWTLFYPDGSQVSCNDCTKELQDYQSQDLQYHEFNFTQTGIYKLRLEAWNDQHGYEAFQLNPAYTNSLSFYDFEEKEITVSNNLPALEVTTPAVPYIDNVSATGNEDVVLEFVNPGTVPINWEIISSNPDCVALQQQSSGNNLIGSHAMNLNVLPNLLDDERYSVITINGRDANGAHVQGSPSYFTVYQNSIDGAWRDYIFGQTPGYSFGYSVSIDGLVMVIGAPAFSGRGKAFIYEKNEYGDWINRATLLPSDNNLNFGKSVDIYGDFVIVSGEGSNNAYIFKKPANGWSGNLTETRPILNSFSNQTGINVTIWGDYAVVGAPYHDDRGVVLVYCRNEGGIDNWGLVKRFDGPANDDQFGESVDLYNDILVVGAPQGGSRDGYINIYDRNLNTADSWGLIQTLAPQYPSSEPNVKFGQRVSVFNDAIATSYFIDNGGYISPLIFPLYRMNNGRLFELLDDANFGLQYGPFFNIIGSISLFKDTEHPKPAMFNYKATYGSEFRYNNQGISGIGSFSQYFIGDNNYYFQWDFPLEEILPGDLFGKSVSRSYGYEIIGIPGYSRDESHGAIVFQKLTNIKSNLEAGINFEFCNFRKPSGNYSTVNAASLSLGGNSLPAVIESGANIQYEAGEIILKDGFLADLGSDFTAVALQQPGDPGKYSDSDKTEPETTESRLAQLKSSQILKAYQHAYPDFPWINYNPIEDIKISIPEQTPTIAFKDKFDLKHQAINDTIPPLSPIQTYYILNLPGNDKKLSLPVKSF